METPIQQPSDKVVTHKEHRKGCLLADLMASYLDPSTTAIEQLFANHVEYTLARSAWNMDNYGAYEATAYSMRDRIIEYWNDTQNLFHGTKTKMIYYLSIEFLLGRSLQNAMLNMDMENKFTEALSNLGYKLEDLYDEEIDAALGNGGLGRLAACFLDSMATMNLPAWGYGLRYQYGMFKQMIHDAQQTEMPDFWLSKGIPLEIPRRDIKYIIRLYGETQYYINGFGETKWRWVGGKTVYAMAYDIPIPGYGTINTNNLRLWSSVPVTTFDLDQFNKGDYYESLRQRQETENITSVLYPNDQTYEGRELRFKQQYFFCAASLADIMRRYKNQFSNSSFVENFGQKVQIQLNDTHPTVSILELLRILLDIENLSWKDSMEIVHATFAYTNHTVLPEALEEWPIEMFRLVLPRHLQLVFELNQQWLDETIEKHFPGDAEKRGQFSIIRNDRVRMAYLAVVCCHSVNGVAQLHTEILKADMFNHFYQLFPEKFNNKTNGVTVRRWINQANRNLGNIITEYLGSTKWLTEFTSEIGKLRNFVNDHGFQDKIANAKYTAKVKLAKVIKGIVGIKINPNALFDVHVKRIHEYKRQLLNILGVIHRYLEMKATSPEDLHLNYTRRVSIFGGKAAPGYLKAKNIIRLICSVAAIVNADPSTNEFLKVIFIPNYSVSLAEVIIPASDISEHISTAGTEASGTSNMKFAMNGGLIFGTHDGANIEMKEEIGEENMFLFGLKAEEVEPTRAKGAFPIDARLKRVLDSVYNYEWANEKITKECFLPLIESILYGDDYYLVARDFPEYVATQCVVDYTYRNKKKWTKMCIQSIAGSGKFCSDRTIQEYATDIWNVKPVKVPDLSPDTVRYHC
jgi:starch phosphorylase